MPPQKTHAVCLHLHKILESVNESNSDRKPIHDCLGMDERHMRDRTEGETLGAADVLLILQAGRMCMSGLNAYKIEYFKVCKLLCIYCVSIKLF